MFEHVLLIEIRGFFTDCAKSLKYFCIDHNMRIDQIFGVQIPYAYMPLTPGKWEWVCKLVTTTIKHWQYWLKM